MTAQKLSPIHPGEILLEEFLEPLGISQNRLGRDLGIPAQRINDIVRGGRSITTDTALRLARYFGTTPEFWLNLQSHYDLEMAEETQLIKQIKSEVRKRKNTQPNPVYRGRSSTSSCGLMCGAKGRRSKKIL